MLNLEDLNLIELLPSSLQSDNQVKAAAQGISEQLRQVTIACMEPALFSRIDQLTSGQLDHLSWQFDAKVWRDTWPVSLKRSVIRTVILEKSKKGTRRALEQAIASLGSSVVIREWFEMDPPGIPHTFEIVVSVGEIEGQLTAQTEADVRLRIEEAKPVRSQYELTLATQALADLYLAGASRPTIYARMNTVEQI
jgi:phage tail P2-like protein